MLSPPLPVRSSVTLLTVSPLTSPRVGRGELRSRRKVNVWPRPCRILGGERSAGAGATAR